jgi:hypothetical protein
MHGSAKRFAVAAFVAASLMGCGDFLSGPSVGQDPNNPSVEVASADNLLVGIQSAQFNVYAMSFLTEVVCGYMQQCKGAVGTGVEFFLNDYFMDLGLFEDPWNQTYGTGGLRAVREAQRKLEARTVRDPRYDGIMKLWEAIIVSHAADGWGDIPYSEAARDDVAQPRLDDQLTIYASLLTRLDQAMVQIADPSGVGPAAADLVYGGDPVAWTALAHTLKARIYLHTVRANCAVLAGCGVYNNVVAEATQGLPVDGSLDFNAVVSGTTIAESNFWFNVYAFGFGVGPELRAGDLIVNLMGSTGRNDPRFASYFADASACGISDPEFGLVIYRSCRAGAASFPQPWITGDENALMLAEAYLQVGGGDPAVPLNAVRAKYSLPPTIATLQSIMEEKYIALFQNLEVWSDWKRTCLPVLTPTGDQAPIPGTIPRRAYYGGHELDNNRNVPSASLQVGTGGTQLDGTPANLPGFRNKNDPPPPKGCP